MLSVGITGGIGSGKSVVCRVFSALGIPVFNADTVARMLMEQDAKLVSGISALLGDEVYFDGKLIREKVSAAIFNNPQKLEQINALVHPAVISYGKQWKTRQKAPYVLKESALFFESGSYMQEDVIIGVYAPKELRIERAMKRSGLSHEKILSIMLHQLDEDEKMKRCNYVIINDDITPVLPQVINIHQQLMLKAAG